MNAPKDHYVAQTYLKHFRNENGKLWVYSKKHLDIHERATKSICREAGWSDNPYFENPRVIEEYLRVYENQWSQAVEMISIDTPSWANFQDAKPLLAGYLAYLKLFPPAAVRAGKTALEEIVKVRIIAARDQGLIPSPPIGYEYLLEDIENQVRIEIDQKYPHTIATRILFKQTQSLAEMPWVLIQNRTGTPFITSDNPACNWFVGKSQIGMTFLALSPNLAILTKPHIPGRRTQDKDQKSVATPKFVDEMNTLVIKCSEQRVIANIRSEQVLNRVSQFHDWHYTCITSRFPAPYGALLLQKWTPVQKR